MIDLVKENYKVLFIAIIVWFIISTFIMPTLRVARGRLRAKSFFRNQYIKNSMFVLKIILCFTIIFVLIDLQVKYNLMDISNRENSTNLVISILTIYGIIYGFIQFAHSYFNQKENDKYWGESIIEVLLNQSKEFSFFHSHYFKLILLYSIIFPLINWEVIPIINEFQIFMLAFWEVCIAIIYVLYVLLFTKSLFIMKHLFSFKKMPDFSTKLFIERKKKEEYQDLFNYAIQHKENLFLSALFKEAMSLEDTEKKEVFKVILIDTLESFRMMQEKMIRKQKKKKKRNIHFLYRKFSYLYRSESLKVIDLSFDELLSIYQVTEKIIFNEMRLQTDNDKSKLVTELINLYSEKNAFRQECTYYNVPQIIWDKVDSNADLLKLDLYVENKDVKELIQQKLTNKPNINLNPLIDSQKNYINKLLDQSKEYLEAFEKRTSTFVFKNNNKEFIKDNIYYYIRNLEFTEENKRYIDVLIKSLDYKYKVLLVFYIMLYPSEDEFRKKQQDVLFWQRMINKSSVNQEISDPDVKVFVLHEIGESHINHRIRPELIESIFENLKLNSTDKYFIQSCIDQPYLSYAKMLKFKFIFNGNYVSFLDFSALENNIIKQNKYETDWKIEFLKEMLRTPSLIKKSFFQRHIIKISEKIIRTNTDDLYKENDFRLFYINPWFRLTEEKCWQLMVEKPYLQDSIFEFLILNFYDPKYEYLLTNDRIAVMFKKRIMEIIYQSTLNIESYVYDLADRANEVSIDSITSTLKIEIIIRKLNALIY